MPISASSREGSARPTTTGPSSSSRASRTVRSCWTRSSSGRSRRSRARSPSGWAARTRTSRPACASRRRCRREGSRSGLPGLRRVSSSTPGSCVVVVLPGPPRELRRLWPRALETEPVRRVLAQAPPREHRVLRFFGTPESAVAEALAAAGGDGDGVEATICAREFEIHVDLFVEPRAAERGAEVADVLRGRLASYLFGEDERSIAEIVLDLGRAQGLTVATAESCTGGMVAARLTAVPGSSDVFLGGVVAYANEVKLTELGVESDTLERHGAVSVETAREMAAGVRVSARGGHRRRSHRCRGTGRWNARQAGRPRLRACDRPGRRGNRSHRASRRPGDDPRAGDGCLAPPRAQVVGESRHIGVSRAGTVERDERLRLFLALEVPADISSALAEWGAVHLIRPADGSMSSTSRSRSSAPNLERSFHPCSTPYAARLARPSPSRSSLSATGRRARSGCSSSPIRAAARLGSPGACTGVSRRSASTSRSAGPWLPHVTVVRFRERPRLDPPPPETGPFVPSGVAAFLSRLHPSGARYEVLESCSLGAVS